MIMQVLILVTLLARTNAVSLAVAGYVAASNPVRNRLISTGIGGLISRGADSFYDASGFRYISDQGTTIRKAQLTNHELVELFENEQKKNVSLKQKVFKVENLKYSERLFNVLNEMDKRTCVERLICEIGADPLKFGFLGLKMKHYLQSIPPVTWNSQTFAYKESFLVGLNNGTEMCLQSYSDCKSDLDKAMSWWMTRHRRL